MSIINSTGDNLSVVIAAKTGDDWKSYTTWFSIVNTIPEAKVVLACFRDGNVDFQYFQWAKRIKLPLYYVPFKNEKIVDQLQTILIGIQKNLLTENVLVVDPNIVIADCLSVNLLDLLNSQTLIKNEAAIFVRNANKERVAELIDDFWLLGSVSPTSETPLYGEAKNNNDEHSLISYFKGCGRWIDTMKGCPLASAGALVSSEMSVNEVRIIELWKEAASFYSAIH